MARSDSRLIGHVYGLHRHVDREQGQERGAVCGHRQGRLGRSGAAAGRAKANAGPKKATSN